MAYRIRYGPRRVRGWGTGHTLGLQAVMALCLAAAVVGIWRFSDGGAGVLGRVLTPGEGLLETATRDMAAALTAGEGWYEGFAQFCGRIIHGPA